MKKLVTFGAIVSLVVGLAALGGTDAAFAARHRHKPNHLHCGAGTHRSGNKCVPNQTTPPSPSPGTGSNPPPPFTGFPGTFQGNVTISPSLITLTRTGATTGSFTGTFFMNGLPPSGTITIIPPAGGNCPMTGGGVFAGSSFGGSGSVSFPLSNGGTCQPGTYAINATASNSPGLFFTAFVTTQLF